MNDQSQRFFENGHCMQSAMQEYVSGEIDPIIFIVHIERYFRMLPAGRIVLVGYDMAFLFHGYAQMLLTMENLIHPVDMPIQAVNEWKLPQGDSCTEKKEAFWAECSDMACQLPTVPEMYMEDIDPHVCFQVSIRFLQHTSWQGEVALLVSSKGEMKLRFFRSAWELLQLMENALASLMQSK